MAGEKQIIIAIGSNYNPRHNLSHAEMILRKHFPNIIFSKPMHTTPIGIVSPDFINRIALCSTAEPLDMILKDIKQNGTNMWQHRPIEKTRDSCY